MREALGMGLLLFAPDLILESRPNQRLGTARVSGTLHYIPSFSLSYLSAAVMGSSVHFSFNPSQRYRPISPQFFLMAFPRPTEACSAPMQAQPPPVRWMWMNQGPSLLEECGWRRSSRGFLRGLSRTTVMVSSIAYR